MEKEGIKYDNGKPRLAEMVVDFKEPLLEVCKVWEFGANKYEKSNWKKVENGADRYTNAMLRHLVAEADSLTDDESELKHAAHVAWNALARLKFLLDECKESQEQERRRRCRKSILLNSGALMCTLGDGCLRECDADCDEYDPMNESEG